MFAWQNKLYFQEKAEGIKEGKTCSILKFQQYGYFYILFWAEGLGPESGIAESQSKKY